VKNISEEIHVIFSLSIGILLSGAITDLENRHSVLLKRFFEAFAQIAFDKGQGIRGVLIQRNRQNLLDFRCVQFELHVFQLHVAS
jgi:hypothetical protein